MAAVEPSGSATAGPDGFHTFSSQNFESRVSDPMSKYIRSKYIIVNHRAQGRAPERTGRGGRAARPPS